MLDTIREVFLIALYTTAIFLLLYIIIESISLAIRRRKHEKEAREFAEKCALDFRDALMEVIEEAQKTETKETPKKKTTKKNTKKVK